MDDGSNKMNAAVVVDRTGTGTSFWKGGVNMVPAFNPRWGCQAVEMCGYSSCGWRR